MGLLLGAVKILLAVQATIVGTVRDGETGAPLAGAIVVVTELDRAAVTDADGHYVLRQVPAGPHHITVRFIGYAHRSLHALVPGDGQLEINVALRPLPARLQTVEVRAPVIVRGLDGADTTAFPDRASSMAAAWNHPLLAEPDALQALAGGEVVVRPESPSGVHIRGAASDHTAYLLDGIPVFSPYHAAGVFSGWNPDALSGVRLSSAAPSLANPHALSGAVEAVTRAPGDHARAQGGVSTTQARLTVDGPLGVAGAGYLVSLRSGFPGILAPRKEASYVRGEIGDWLTKVEAPLFGGRARLLTYESENEINAASAVQAEDGIAQDGRRNVFAWRSRSAGAGWTRTFPRATVRILGWSALGEASSEWTADAARVDMTSIRRDEGLLAAVERRSHAATTLTGIRLERSRTSYRVESDAAGRPSWRVSARTPVATAFAQYARAFGKRIELELGVSVGATAGNVYPGPRAQLRWDLSEQVSLASSYARTHQFAQSLRNPESVVGNVFPTDLYAGAGGPGIPVARSDQGVIAADYQPSAGVRLGVQAYERRFDGLLHVAPRSGGPFTMGAFAVGSGVSRGVSVDGAVSAARYGILASYGLQRVRLEYGDSSYVPDYAATHLLEGGVIVFPTATASIRLGATAAIGRRTTTVAGGLEWEACNLLDQGCEFGGSPHNDGEPLGATTLPAYLRVDLGIRKHWHVGVGERDVMIAVFGTVTNVFGRPNVLTYAKDPSTGQIAKIGMRPLAPLVVGLDWRF